MKRFYIRAKSVWWGVLMRLHPQVHGLVFRYRIYVKYIASGGTAAAVNLGSIWILVEFFRLHYLLASVLAFIIAFVVSFTLQKFFTFGDTTTHLMHRQLFVYLSIALGNLLLNTLLVYFFTDIVRLWYILSQAVSGIIIAVESFFLYRRFVFINH